MPAIEVRGLRKTYGSRSAVSGIDLSVPLGEVFALLGPNGAGKTTTVEILEGHRRRDSGDVRVLGQDPAIGGRAWRARIGIVLQSATDAATSPSPRPSGTSRASTRGRGMLEAEPDLSVVGEASSGPEGVALAAELRPDIVLMDLRMPGGDGVEATARIVATVPGARVMVLTTYESDRDILRAIEAGGGYLLKDASRRSWPRASGWRPAVRPCWRPASPPPCSGRSAAPRRRLSAREAEVLRLVARGLTNADIGRELYIAEATVKTHLLRALAKLDVADRTAAVTRAMGHGML